MSMVTFVYDLKCEQAQKSRGLLMKAFAETKTPALWSEWVKSDPDCPDHYKHLESPSVVIKNTTCNGLNYNELVNTLRKKNQSKRSILLGVVSAAVALFPKAACPA